MTYEVSYRVGLGNAKSPFRVVAQPEGREVGWINRFLDQCAVRGLAWHTLRGCPLFTQIVCHFVDAVCVRLSTGVCQRSGART